MPPSTVFGVATFYHYFTLKPAGEHTAVVCTGTACYINGASGILAAIRDQLGIGPKETTADGKVSLLTARCLGACSLAPAAIVDGEVQGRVDGPALVDGWTRCDRRTRAPPAAAPAPAPAAPPRPARQVTGLVPREPVRASAYVCEAVSCLSTGSQGVLEALVAQVTGEALADVAVKRVGCLGLCASGPLVQVPGDGRRVHPRHARRRSSR